MTNLWALCTLNIFFLLQDVVYEDKDQLETVLNKLRRLPPLVSPVEVSWCLGKPHPSYADLRDVGVTLDR